MLVPANESKKKIKNIKNCGLKQNLIGPITKNSDDYNEKYMKIKLNSDDALHLNKMIK